MTSGDDPTPRGGGAASALTVLVIVPDLPNREGLVRRLRSTIDRVIDAPSGEDALYLTSVRAIDVVVTAFALPGMGADALLRELRLRGGPPVVALLERDAAERAAWLDAGGAGCVGAFDDPVEVRARFASILRRADLGQAARRPPT